MNSEKLYDQVYTFDDQDQATTGEQELSFDKYKEWGDKVLGAMKAEQGSASEDQTTRWEELNIDHTGRLASVEQPTSVEQEPATPESTTEKVKKKSAFKKIKAIAAALALTAALAGCTGGNNAESKPTDAAAAGIEDVERPSYNGNREKQTYESLTGSELLDEMIDGSFEQYDNPGGHDRAYIKNPDLKREGRPDIYSATSVANVADILQFMAENELIEDISDVKPEEWGMAYKFVTFSQKEPAAYVAIGAQVPGFENLSYHEAVAKIDAMTPEEKQLFQQDLQDVFGRTTFTEDQVQGTVESYYIGEKNGEKQGFVDSIDLAEPTGTIVMNIGSETLYTDDHYVMTDDGEMVLASALATESKEDDGQTTKLTILKRCFNGGKHVTIVENGSGEITVIVIPAKPEEKPADHNTGQTAGGNPNADNQDSGQSAGGNPNADNTNNGSDTGTTAGGNPTGTGTPTDTGTPTGGIPGGEDPGTTNLAIPESKNPELEIKNAPEDITSLTINNVVTPPTTEEQDQENFDVIKRQQEEDQRRQQEAARRQREQAEAEKRAAEEAEKRRKEAEAAEQKRQAELEEQKRQADEAERKRLEEAEKKRQQEEADARARADAAARQAEAEAQARQEAAAAAERARQQEEAERKKAQDDANRLAEQQRAEAERNANTQNVGQNADIFNNGDF